MLAVQIVCDILEVTGVFLLAVEAIKISNFSNLKNKAVLPLSYAINPRIKFVNELPANSTFFQKHFISIFFLVLYAVGASCIFLLMHHFGYSLTSLKPSSILGWLGLVLSLCYLPLLGGFFVYQFGVWLLSGSATFLGWVESQTQSGVVGIVGFVLYLVQFISRRVFAP